MPSSLLQCAPEVLHLVSQVPHRSVLDVGAGPGKYGALLREYVAGVHWVGAVEAWGPYITPRLRCLYDEVIEADALTLDTDTFARYDCVLLVDVLEHFTHADGEALLDRIPSAVVICTPAQWFQNPEAASIWTEEHRSLWTPEQFAAMPRCTTRYENEWGAVLALLQPKPQ